MANYYYITINDEKVTQEFCEEILNNIVKTNLIRHLSFHEGYFYCNTRGLPKAIIDLIQKYNIDEKNIEIMDEFEYLEEHFEEPPRRTEQEIIEYEKEAFEKVWLMRTHPCDNPKIEAGRQASVERILATYDDIPEDGYSDWECGYWNGVMATCRWVLGDEEKDNLDT